jgi:hypothetical protein
MSITQLSRQVVGEQEQKESRSPTLALKQKSAYPILETRDPRVSAWLPYPCPSCGIPQLGLLVEARGCCVVCVHGCQVEFSIPELLRIWPTLANWLPDGEIGPEKYGRARKNPLTFGQGLGTNQTGTERSETLRYCIDIANDWQWNPRVPNGPAERDQVYAMKSTIGIFESKSMKSAVELCSRKIRQVESARHIKIPEPRVNSISSLVRKGIREAERLKKTTNKDRRVAVECILGKEGFWPP